MQAHVAGNIRVYSLYYVSLFVITPFILNVRLHLFGIMYGRISWVTQEESHTGVFFSFPHLPSAVLASTFYREKDSAAPFPRRP